MAIRGIRPLQVGDNLSRGESAFQTFLTSLEEKHYSLALEHLELEPREVRE